MSRAGWIAAVCAGVLLAPACGGDSHSSNSSTSTAPTTAVTGVTSAATTAGTPAPTTTATTTGPPATVTPTTDAPMSSEPVEVSADAVLPEGFTTATVRITEPDGTICEVCMWLADDATERGRGLMGVTDLGDAAGMVFVFDRPTSGSFFMFQTVTPLSIAWFDPAGTLAATADMDPCESDTSAQCQRFSPGARYTVAVEVFQGDLASIGIDDGSRIEVRAGTEAPTCPRS